MFTVLWIAGTRPDHLSGLRSPDQATSKIFVEALPVLRPALNDLDAVKIGGGRVLHRPDDECRGRSLLPGWHGGQIRAHGNAARIGLLHPVLGVQDLFAIAPAAE